MVGLDMSIVPGDPLHVQGFILNKLYVDGCWAHPGKRPRKHYSKTDLPKGYDKSLRGEFKDAIKELKKLRVIMEFPHHGDGEHHFCAIRDDTLIAVGLPICNMYRRAVGLPHLNAEFEEIFE